MLRQGMGGGALGSVKGWWGGFLCSGCQVGLHAQARDGGRGSRLSQGMVGMGSRLRLSGRDRGSGSMLRLSGRAGEGEARTYL
jgi:hypothetical protein